MNDNQTFEVIVTLSSYIYLKEKYKNKLENKEKSEDLTELTSLMTKLEKYAHLPDREMIVRDVYHELLSKVDNGYIHETSLINQTKEMIKPLNEEEKRYILNSIVFVANIDKTISDTEWGQIKQVSKTLGFDNDKKIIEDYYNQSEFAQKVSTPLIFGFLLLIFFIVSGGGYFYYQKNQANINIFDNKKIVFTELSYNRYVVYKNKFPVEDEHFLKQEIFYASGSAEVGIDPSSLVYDKTSQVLKVLHPKETIFSITLNPNKTLHVDSIKPKGLTKKEANIIGAVVGIAGAVGGAKAGSSLSTLLPPPYGLVSTVGGAILGGAIAYGATSSALNGLKLSKELSEKEKQIILKTANKLILVNLHINSKLQQMYKERFEEYMRFKYGMVNLKIKSFQYEVIK